MWIREGRQKEGFPVSQEVEDMERTLGDMEQQAISLEKVKSGQT
jgi:hypothetical protein